MKAYPCNLIKCLMLQVRITLVSDWKCKNPTTSLYGIELRLMQMYPDMNEKKSQ